MSRHVIRKDDSFEVVVGYDGPLKTFFAQVYDVKATREAEKDDPLADEVMVLWEGVKPDEIASVHDLAKLVEPYALITEDMFATLYLDRSEAPEPTAFQKEMIDRIKGATDA